MDSKVKTIDKLNTEDLEVLERLVAMPTLIFDLEKVHYVNGLLTDTLGYSINQINEVGITNLLCAPFAKRYNQLVKNALSGLPFIEQGEICFKTPHKQEHWVEYKARVVDFYGKKMLLAHLLDINEKKHVQQHLNRLLILRESMLEVTQSIMRSEGISELYKVILKSVVSAIDNAHLGTIMLRDHNSVRPVAQIGFLSEDIEAFSIPIKELFLYKSVGPGLDQIAKVDDLKVFGDYHKIKTVHGEDAYIRSTISAPIYINGDFFGAVNVDSTELNAFNDDDVKLMEFVRNNVEIAISNQLLYEEKAFLSRFDSLTALYNRHYFDEVFENIRQHALRYGNRFHLVVFDLNDLKRTNDEYGHIVGDYLLRHFSDSCKKLMRKSDILARYGGDEFVGIFFNSTVDNLKHKIDGHLKTLMLNPMEYDHKRIVCSYSYGIATFDVDGKTLNELFRVADDRMYANKIRYKLGFDFIDAVEYPK